MIPGFDSSEAVDFLEHDAEGGRRSPATRESAARMNVHSQSTSSVLRNSGNTIDASSRNATVRSGEDQSEQECIMSRGVVTTVGRAFL